MSTIYVSGLQLLLQQQLIGFQLVMGRVASVHDCDVFVALTY
jgi:hypothetical protein